MTSIYEGSSIILKEALASGIPVIANRDSDPDGNIINGKNGFLEN
jgi:glycosyltransferase involved in cell wall biosynthesis